MAKIKNKDIENDEYYNYTPAKRHNNKYYKKPSTISNKRLLIKTGNFGIPGTKEYNDNVHTYFNLGKLSEKAIENIKDEQKRYRIVSNYNEREKEINSGVYLSKRSQESKEKLIEIIKQYIGSEEDFEINWLLQTINNLGDKETVILSALWDVINDYYTSVKENLVGKDYSQIEKDMDDTITRLINVLQRYNL